MTIFKAIQSKQNQLWNEMNMIGQRYGLSDTHIPTEQSEEPNLDEYDRVDLENVNNECKQHDIIEIPPLESIAYTDTNMANVGTRTTKKKRRSWKRVFWTTAETQAVIQGYEKYQKYANPDPGKYGICAHIKRDKELSKILQKRRTKQLNDKWRHLKRMNDKRIQHLIKNKSSIKLKNRELILSLQFFRS